MAGGLLGAAPGPSARDKAAPLPPTCLDGPTLDAPDCVADHDPRKNRADALRKLCASFCFHRTPLGWARGVAFCPPPPPQTGGPAAPPGRAIRAPSNPRPP